MALIPTYVKNKFTADEIQSLGDITGDTLIVNDITVTNLNVTTINTTTINATTINSTDVNATNINVTDTVTSVTVEATTINTTDLNATGDITGDTITVNTGTIGTANVTTLNAVAVNVLTFVEAQTLIASSLQLKSGDTDATNVIKKCYRAVVPTVTLKGITEASPLHIDTIPANSIAILNSCLLYYRAGATPFTATGSSFEVAISYPSGGFNATLTRLGTAFDGSSFFNQATSQIASIATPTNFNGIIDPAPSLAGATSLTFYNAGTALSGASADGTLMLSLEVTYILLPDS